MALGPNSVRSLLYGINFIFVLTGIVLCAHGMENLFFYRNYANLVQEQYVYISYFQIIVGLLICAIAIVGWYGAIAESSVVTLMFSTSLLLIFFLELSVGIGSYFLNITTRNSLNASLRLPNGTSDYTMLYRWERLQTDFSCCGIETPLDWFTQNEEDVLPVLPDSCCYQSESSWKISDCFPRNSYRTGCFVPLEAEIQDNCLMVSLICFTVATFQLLGIILTCYLSGEFRKEYQSF
ncbi:tetraspanin-6-like [Atheta coriaria]|uniref:tetraspanin-6-like n=1 Tax=Dalotia coriaria TaxID=877792 RepID=UPI0031F413F4